MYTECQRPTENSRMGEDKVNSSRCRRRRAVYPHQPWLQNKERSLPGHTASWLCQFVRISNNLKQTKPEKKTPIRNSLVLWVARLRPPQTHNRTLLGCGKSVVGGPRQGVSFSLPLSFLCCGRTQQGRGLLQSRDGSSADTALPVSGSWTSSRQHDETLVAVV